MKQYQNITITLVIATILIVSLSIVMPKNKEKYLRDRFWTQKTFAPAQYDVVIIGDSRIYRGVSPLVMEQLLPGLKVLNFGYSNGGLNQTMFEAAEMKLSSKGKQRIIVVGITANCITGFTLKNEQYLQEKNRPREDVFERLYLNGILYYFSPTTPQAIKETIQGKKSSCYYSNEYYSNGYVKSDKFPVDTMEAIASYIDDFTNYKVEDRYIDVLLNQVSQWNSRGIKVLGFRPPVPEPMRALEDTLGLYNEAKIRARFTKHSGHWIDLKPSEYSTYDGSHLDEPSAYKLSERIAKEILALEMGNQ